MLGEDGVLRALSGGQDRRSAIIVVVRRVRRERQSFGLGFSLPDNKTLTNRLLDIGHKDEDLISAGICRRNDSGQLSEVFRGRLMIPISVRNGDIAGFGARTLDNRQPKYLNSPQTQIFDKSRILYGIDKAYRSIQKDNTVVVVEGYMDAIRAVSYTHLTLPTKA